MSEETLNVNLETIPYDSDLDLRTVVFGHEAAVLIKGTEVDDDSMTFDITASELDQEGLIDLFELLLVALKKGVEV